MWNRIYAAMVVLCCVITGFFVFYAASWLNSIGSPRDAFEGFLYYARLAQFAMWISFFILAIAANIVLWVERGAWALWTTLLFMVVFLFVRLFWLENSAESFAEKNGFDASGLRWGFVLAVLASAATAGLIYFDVFLVTRLRDRMHPPSRETEKAVEEHADEQTSENEKDLAE